MKKIKALRQRKADLAAKARGIIDAAEKDNNSVLSEEQKKQLADCKTEIAGIDATIAEYEALAEIERSIEGQTEQTDDTSPAQPRGTQTGPFRTFGEQLLAVMNSSRPGARADERLFQVQGAATGLNETAGSEGGFLVQTEFSNELLRRVYQEGDLASRVRRIPSSSGANSLKINGVDETSRANGSRWGGVQAYWEGEADQYTAKKPKFDQLELRLKKLTGLCYMTDELIEDAAAIASIVDQAFTEEFGFKVDNAIFEGDGAGKPLGIVKSGALVSVAKEAGQAAATVKVENVTKMWARMPSRNRRNAVWLIHADVEPQLIGMTIGNQPVYLPAGGVTDAPLARLMGRPVIPTEFNEALGTKNDIVLADLSQYVLYDKNSIQKASSIHVRFEYGEQCFRFTYRCDGQPTWRTAVAPLKGANSVSPFITLDTRA
jgi:HK97 family phage major capsid protein